MKQSLVAIIVLVFVVIIGIRLLEKGDHAEIDISDQSGVIAGDQVGDQGGTGDVTGGGGVGILPFDSGITGTVSLGPTCPVMQNPPDPQCADKPYQTTVQIFHTGSASGAPFATMQTDANGVYKFMLPPGEYSVQAVSGKVFPRCGSATATVAPSVVSTVNLSCDTGIR